MEKALRLQEEMKKIFGDAPVNLVGGSVRDIILDRTPKDWDYCTPLSPDEVESLIKKAGRRVYDVGKRFGTLGFKLEVPTMPPTRAFEFVYVEVTTYRTEVYDGKTRKPEVKFINDLMADLSRRDFTINAMTLKEDGTIYDPFGGRLDILARQVKTVGLPKDRIQEDPLRMLRAARFASQLDFSVDPNMIGKMSHLAPSIMNVSRERWVDELDKLLLGKNVMRGIKVLMQSEVMKYILPEVYLSLQDEDIYHELSTRFNALESDVSLDERWAILLAYIAHPYTFRHKNGAVTFPNHEVIRQYLVSGICARLKFSNKRTDALVKDKTIYNKNIDI